MGERGAKGVGLGEEIASNVADSATKESRLCSALRALRLLFFRRV